MKKYILSLFFIFVQISFSQTYIPAGEINGETWHKENAPYHITGSVTVTDLTIEPGVEVLFDGNYTFTVSGKLTAEGFYSDSIYFRSSDTNSDGWDGIGFVAGADLSSLKYCNIENGVNQGISVENTSPKIANCRIYNNSGNGLKLSNTSLSLLNCRIEKNDIYGIYLNDVRLTINNSIIAHNTQDGFYSINGNDSLVITNCVIADNYGSGVFSLSGVVIIKNSILDNGNTDIDAGSPDVTYSNVLDGIQGTGNISVNPQFTDNINYNISDISPCIDAGNPAAEFSDKFFPPSKGSARNDMGVYGGPGAGKCYPAVATLSDVFDFGNVSLDSTKKSLIKIMNYRDEDIIVSAVELISDIFSTDVTGFTLTASDTFNLEVNFTPPNKGVFNDTIKLSTQNQGEFFVAVRGTGVVADIDIPLVEINYASVNIGDSDSSEVTIINRGYDTLRISQILTTDSAFYSNKKQLNIAPRSADNSLQITFRPDSAKSYIDSLILISNDPDEGRVAIALKGNSHGPVISLDKNSLNFDKISLIPDTSLALKIENLGDRLLTVQNIDIDRQDSVFTVTDADLPQNISAGQSYVFHIRYKAQNSGKDHALLHITSNDPVRTIKTVSLTGPGQIPVMTVLQNNLSFGRINIDESKIDSICIYNFGDGTLIIDSLVMRGEQRPAFGLTAGDSTAININAGDSLFIGIRFQPVIPDSNSANLFIFGQDIQNPADTVTLYGYGTAPYINLSRTLVNFGDIKIDSSAADTLLIYNRGEANLIVDSLVIKGLDKTSFNLMQTDTNPIIIKPDSAYMAAVQFSPQKQGTNKAGLFVFSNGYNSKKDSLTLTGRGLAPKIELSNTSIVYDTVAIDFVYMDPVADSICVKNTGTSALKLFPDQFIFKGDTSVFIINTTNTNTNIAPGDSTFIRILLQTFDVGSLQAELKIISNDPFSDTVSVVMQAFAKDKPAKISYDSNSSTKEFFDNKNATLSFNIETYSSVDEASLYFRMGGEIGWRQSPLSKQNDTHLWAVTLNAQWLTARGVEYYVVVKHGYTTSSWSKDNPRLITVTVTALPAFSTTREKFYQLISIPLKSRDLTLSALLLDKLGAYDDTKYRIFDCRDGINNIEIKDNSDKLLPGKSYWLITKESVTLDMNDTTYSVPVDENYNITLHKGWNLISSPFPFPVSWDDVDSAHALRYYNEHGDWAFAAVLNPYKGYAVYTENAVTLSVPPIETETKENLQKLNNNADEWYFTISAECGNLKDSYNFAGIKKDATNEIDRYDYPEPLSPGEYISIYLLQNGTNIRYSSDYRKGGDQGYIFDFELSSNISGEKSVTVSDQNVPEDLSWIIVSPETRVIYTDNVLKTSANKIRYRLIVGTNDYIQENSADYTAAPLSFQLSQNYPNPFNPATKIRYQLPERSTVTIDIYNILGQHIKTLIDNKTKDAGYYQIRWDGTNSSGTNVTSGIYFLFLKTKHFRRGIKMILQR